MGLLVSYSCNNYNRLVLIGQVYHDIVLGNPRILNTDLSDSGSKGFSSRLPYVIAAHEALKDSRSYPKQNVDQKGEEIEENDCVVDES